MLLSKEKSLEDRIVERLMDGRASVKALHLDLLGTTPDLSLRAVYKAADKLMSAGVLLKTGKTLAIDEEWARGLQDKMGSAGEPLIGKGERRAYTFTSIEHLDAFWTGIASRLEDREGHELFFYNPHNFWAYMPERKESEDRYYRHFAEKGVRGFFTVGGDTLADMEFKRAYQNEHFQVDARQIPALGRTDHLTVIGDVIIRVRLPRKIAAQMDELYASGRPIAELLPELIPLYRSRMTTRLIMEHDGLKARKLRKLFALNFYFWRPE